jgi:hypothetical protein
MRVSLFPTIFWLAGVVVVYKPNVGKAKLMDEMTIDFEFPLLSRVGAVLIEIKS